METPQKKADDSTGSHFSTFYGIFKQGGYTFPNDRLIIVGLGLVNVILLVAAVVIGINCAKVKDGSLHVSHSAATQLLNELDYLHSNHSDVIEAEEEAKKALETALKNHTQINCQIEQKRIINEGYQKQIETLRTEKTHLQSNISALEGTCGKCLSGWVLLNSSCYFFSYSESATVKKNWPDSRADCVHRGADLIIIDNQEEQIFVSDRIENMKSGRNVWENGFWIGLTDTHTEGTWVWINNVTEVEQRYWMEGEPNDMGRLGEDCGIVVYSSTNPWKTRYDANCHQIERQWICEMASR